MQRDSSARSSDGNLDLVGTLRVLRRRAPLIAMCVLLTAGAAFFLSKAQHKQHTATAQVLFRNAQLDQQAAGLQVVNQTNPQPGDGYESEAGHLATGGCRDGGRARSRPEAERDLERNLGHPGVRHRPGPGRGDLDVSDGCRTDSERIRAERHREPAASRRELLLECAGGGQPPVQSTYAGTAERRGGSRPRGPSEFTSDPQPAPVG